MSFDLVILSIVIAGILLCVLIAVGFAVGDWRVQRARRWKALPTEPPRNFETSPPPVHGWADYDPDNLMSGFDRIASQNKRISNHLRFISKGLQQESYGFYNADGNEVWVDKTEDAISLHNRGFMYIGVREGK